MSRLGFGFVAAALALSAPAIAGEVRFSPDDGHAQNPVWSADGKWVAFEVNHLEGSGVDLFVASVSGGIAKDAIKVQLPGASAFGSGQVAANPTWHPQGLAIFEGSNSGGEYRLYIYTPGGASPTELLKTTQVSGHLMYPTVSGDGNMLSFTSAATGDGDIRTWNRTTNKIEQVTATDGTESFPIYSKDNTKILFTRKHNNTEDIFEYDIASKAERSIVGGGGDQSRPAYTSDGSVVYFTNERDSTQWDLAVVGNDGENKRVIAKNVRLPQRARPAVSPDGEWVAWTTNDPKNGDNNVWMGKVDGSQTVTVATQFTACGEPAITAAGGRVYLAYTYLPQSGADWRHLFVEDVTDKL